MKRAIKHFAALCVLLTWLAPGASAEKFSFVALGDTAYNGEPDYPVYRRLIETINKSKPAFSIHIGDIWGASVCDEAHMQEIAGFFDLYQAPLVYTPGDNEWTDCDRRSYGGYDAAERLEKLRDVFFDKPLSQGKKPMALVRQSDVSPHKMYRENSRWFHKGVLFLTLNISGSNNNFAFDSKKDLVEAFERNQANIAWLRDGFRIARENNVAGVVISFHAEFLMNGELPLDSYNGPYSSVYGSMVAEMRLGGERYGKPVLLIHGDSHEFIVDRPLIEPQGESAPAKYANITRLEVFGAPEIKSVKVTVDTKTPWVFSFSPLHNAE